MLCLYRKLQDYPYEDPAMYKTKKSAKPVVPQFHWNQAAEQEIDQVFDKLARGEPATDRIGALIPSGTLVQVDVNYLFAK
jgi:hypothetical protein